MINDIVSFLLMTRWFLKNLQIDWEESSTNDRVCVRPNIDEDLDNRKHVYHGIDSVLVNSKNALMLCIAHVTLGSRL